MAAKYSMDLRTVNKWLNGQGCDYYRLQVLKTPAGLRILDPQLEFPPHRTAPPEELYIYSSRDIANLLGITTRGVRWMADNELVRFRWYGGERFFPLSEIRRLMRERGLFESGAFANLTSRAKLDRHHE